MSSGIVLRMRHRFQNRFVEWLAAFQIMFWGLILIKDGDTFATGHYEYFLSIATEDEWGIFLFTVGAIRLCGLFVNGARTDVTPWIRAVGAGIGFMVFMTIALNFLVPALNGQAWSTALAIYPPAAIAELVAIYFSVRDAKAHRDGRYGTS